MKKTIALCTTLLLAALFGCGTSDEAANTMVVQNYIGTVTIQGRPAEIGDTVASGETVVTGAASAADLVYNESALVRINENSTVRVDSLMAGLKKSTNLSLQKGSMFNTVSKLKDDETYQVSTPTMVAAVRGTSFKVSTDANASDTDVLSGTVKVNPVQDGKVVTQVSNLVGENNHAEIRRDQVQEILKSRKIGIAAIRADRLQKLRNDLNGVDQAVVDRLNPGLRKEYRMKVLQMRQDRFEMMEKQRGQRMQKFLEMKKQSGARIKENFLKKQQKRQGLKELFEKRREKKEELTKERLEKKNELAEKLRQKKEEKAEKRQEKKNELAEKLRQKKEVQAEKRQEKKNELAEKLRQKKEVRAEKRQEKAEKAGQLREKRIKAAESRKEKLQELKKKKGGK